MNRTMFSNEQIAKFQLLYKNRFGKEISQREAYEKGAKLVRLMKLIYRPMTEEEYKELSERRRETGD